MRKPFTISGAAGDDAKPYQVKAVAEARRAIARFHSDAHVTMRSGPPRWFRRIFKRRQNIANARQYLRWLADADYDPVMVARHRHSAKWAWW